MSETKNVVAALSRLSAYATNIFGTKKGLKDNKYSQLQQFIGDINDLMETLELSIHIIPGNITTEILTYEKKWIDNKTNQPMSKSVTEIVGKISCRTFVSHSSGEVFDFGVSEFPLDINGSMASNKTNAANTHLRKLIILGLCNIHFTEMEMVFISQVDEFIESIGTSLLDEASIHSRFGDIKLKFELAKNQKALDYLNSRKAEMRKRTDECLSQTTKPVEIISAQDYKQLIDLIQSEFAKNGDTELCDSFMEGFTLWYTAFSEEKSQRVDDPRKMLKKHFPEVLKEIPKLVESQCKF